MFAPTTEELEHCIYQAANTNDQQIQALLNAVWRISSRKLEAYVAGRFSADDKHAVAAEWCRYWVLGNLKSTNFSDVTSAIYEDVTRADILHFGIDDDSSLVDFVNGKGKFAPRYYGGVYRLGSIMRARLRKD